MAKQLSDMESISYTLGEIAEALKGIEFTLDEINKKIGNFEDCIETRTSLRMIRVADMMRKQ
ncbi:hypothetical protein ACFLV2_00625 [Chloroflexota bacterium]